MPQPDSLTNYCHDYRHLLLLVNQILMPFFFFPYNQISCDLVPADLEGAIGLHLEVKRTERLSHYPAIEQAEAAARRE